MRSLDFWFSFFYPGLSYKQQVREYDVETQERNRAQV